MSVSTQSILVTISLLYRRGLLITLNHPTSIVLQNSKYLLYLYCSYLDSRAKPPLETSQSASNKYLTIVCIKEVSLYVVYLQIVLVVVVTIYVVKDQELVRVQRDRQSLLTLTYYYLSYKDYITKLYYTVSRQLVTKESLYYSNK